MSVGVTIGIVQDGAILLTLREDFEVWCMPGGMLDEGESIAEAARREVREETGLEVELTRLVGIYTQLGRFDDHDIVFAARVVGGTLTPDPHEVLEARFFPLDALPGHLLVGTDEMLRDIAAGRSSVVKTERIVFTPEVPVERAALYAHRDQSGMGRRAYYQRYFPVLGVDQVTIEVEGVTAESKNAQEDHS